jgi:hypothetical protein
VVSVGRVIGTSLQPSRVLTFFGGLSRICPTELLDSAF